jgi:hypothetical protein
MSSVYKVLWSKYQEHNLFAQFHKVESVYTSLLATFTDYIINNDTASVISALYALELLSVSFIDTCSHDKLFQHLLYTPVSKRHYGSKANTDK